MQIDFVFQIAILIMSVVIHEVSHGAVANMLGDPTAKLQGRLTLNPLKHLDMFGSVIVPAISYFFGGFIFGWAKPCLTILIISNLGDGAKRWSPSGPASNLSLAILFGLLLRFGLNQGWNEGLFISLLLWCL